jgi:hypothetical protein
VPIPALDLSITNAGATISGTTDTTSNTTTWSATIFGTVAIANFNVTATWQLTQGIISFPTIIWLTVCYIQDAVTAVFNDGQPGDIVQVSAEVAYTPVNCSTAQGLANPIQMLGNGTFIVTAFGKSVTLSGSAFYNKCTSLWGFSSSPNAVSRSIIVARDAPSWSVYGLDLSNLGMKLASTRV